jgi:crossover junction endodeoxyribonuclease RuvC
MLVVGLDLSTKSGVAVVETGNTILYTEEVVFKKETGIARMGSIAGRILEIVTEYKPDLCVIENYGFSNAHTLVTLVEIGTVVRYFLHQNDINFMLVPPTSLKKFVTGKGNASKDQVMMFILKNWGHESSTNNVADAVGLALFGLACKDSNFTADRIKTCKEVLKGQPDIEKYIGSIP